MPSTSPRPSETLLRILASAFDRLLLVAAIALAFGMLAAAWHDASKAWDVWMYHLPFAARITGIIDAGTYAFGADNRHRFEGFPLFAEALQGLFWRITGRPESANLLSMGALLAMPLFLRRLYRVPAHLSFLALVAIPLVQIHATSAYVDLFANACVTLLLLLAHRAIVIREAPTVRFLLGAAALAAATANAKFQLVPITIAALAVLFVRARGRLRLVLVLALPLVFATPIKNVALHGNPVWPVELRLPGASVPYVEKAYASSPAQLEGSSKAVRFVHSVLEIDNRPIASKRRWSIDQWTPTDEPGYRMGGYFGAYVVVNLVALGWAAWKRRSREALAAAALFGGVTVIAAFVPQSHELRYYMHWMLLLVCLNAILWAREAPAITGAIAAAALAVVAWSTSGWYLYPTGDSFAALVSAKAEPSVIESTPPGSRLCIDREPWTFLYAAPFHPGKRYAVQEASAPSDCAPGDVRPPPP